MKYLKSCLPRRSLLGTNNSLISISSIEIGLLSWWNSYSSISGSSDFIIFLSIFIHGFKFSHNFLNL